MIQSMNNTSTQKLCPRGWPELWALHDSGPATEEVPLGTVDSSFAFIPQDYTLLPFPSAKKVEQLLKLLIHAPSSFQEFQSIVFNFLPPPHCPQAIHK